jgi:plastocyanin
MARLTSLLAVALAACTPVLAKIIPIQAIDVAFVPNTTTAAVGDELEFSFMPHNHSVVMGTFDDPCQPVKTGGFYSGFFVVAEGEGVGFPYGNNLLPILNPRQKLYSR